MRVDNMISAGLLDEVKGLQKYRVLQQSLVPGERMERSDFKRSGAVTPEYPSLRTVGYRELFDYLDCKTNLATAADLIKRNTRRYAKRQLTWWGRDNSIKWNNLSGTKN
jgi:tRNA dimethylallyltransferase